MLRGETWSPHIWSTWHHSSLNQKSCSASNSPNKSKKCKNRLPKRVRPGEYQDKQCSFQLFFWCTRVGCRINSLQCVRLGSFCTEMSSSLECGLDSTGLWKWSDIVQRCLLHSTRGLQYNRHVLCKPMLAGQAVLLQAFVWHHGLRLPGPPGFQSHLRCCFDHFPWGWAGHVCAP